MTPEGLTYALSLEVKAAWSRAGDEKEGLTRTGKGRAINRFFFCHSTASRTAAFVDHNRNRGYNGKSTIVSFAGYGELLKTSTKSAWLCKRSSSNDRS